MITFIILVVGCAAILFVGLIYGLIYAFPIIDLAVFFLLCYGIYKLCTHKKSKNRSKGESLKQ